MEIPNVLPTTFPGFSSFHISVLVNKPVLLVMLGVYFFVYAIISGVLFYHWFAYGMRSRGIIVAESMFFFVSSVLFVMSGLAIFYY